jgi:hydroxymethylbilane synthase
VKPIRLATRRSALAMAQAQQVADQITAATGAPVELVGVTSLGDTSTAALTTIGGTGVFVTAVREAVLSGRADLAVHSMKDLPTGEVAELELVAVPPRGDPADALVARAGELRLLPAGAVIGTGSIRRRAQILRRRPDLDVAAIRGNVDSRLAMVERGEVAGVVLAKAGLDRLGLSDRITQVLDVGTFLPAPGQGALAVEAPLTCSRQFRRAVSAIDDADTRATVSAERAALADLEAGCSAPVGALATVARGVLSLTVVVLAADGGQELSAVTTGAPQDAVALGRAAAGDLLAGGANRFLGERVP